MTDTFKMTIERCPGCGHNPTVYESMLPEEGPFVTICSNAKCKKAPRTVGVTSTHALLSWNVECKKAKFEETDTLKMTIERCPKCGRNPALYQCKVSEGGSWSVFCSNGRCQNNTMFYYGHDPVETLLSWNIACKREENKDLVVTSRTDLDLKLALEAMRDDVSLSMDDLQALCRNIAQAKGWETGKVEDGTLIALMHSELSEALEAMRHGNPDSDHIPVSGVEEELADVIIRVLDYAESRNYQLGQTIMMKLAFNLNREHRHGGKKF